MNWGKSMSEKKEKLFRKKTLDRIKNPEQLDQYLRVTKPKVWFFFAAVLIFFVGLTVWVATGSVDTTVKADVTVKDKKAVITEKEQKESIVKVDTSGVGVGTEVIVYGNRFLATACEENEDGLKVLYADADSMMDGNYQGEIVVESVSAIQFLFG